MASTTEVRMQHNLVLGRNSTKQCGPRNMVPSVPITLPSSSKLLQKEISSSKQSNSNRVASSEYAITTTTTTTSTSKPFISFHQQLPNTTVVPSSTCSTVKTVSSSTIPSAFNLDQLSNMSYHKKQFVKSRTKPTTTMVARGADTLSNTAVIKNAADAFLALHKTKLAMSKVQNHPQSGSCVLLSLTREKLNENVLPRNGERTLTLQNCNTVPALRSTQTVSSGNNLSTNAINVDKSNDSPRNLESFGNQVTKRSCHLETPPSILETDIDSLRMRVDENKMAAYLVCLTSGGGVPLFTRKTAEFKTLPFPLVGSLNGVHMFAKSHDSTLLTTSSEDTDVAWREFNESITLIVVLKDGGRGRTERSDVHLYDFLETVFDAMVLLTGLDNIVNTNNVERLKRDLKCCFCLVDALLAQLTQPSESLSFIGDVARSIDCIVCSESISLQNYLDSFVESAHCNYGSVLVQGKVLVATKEWWSLDRRESSLLSFFLTSTSKATCRDVPVFLPVENPTVAHRLLVFQLVQGVEVCVLCGPTPSLMQLQKEVGRTWKNAYELLKASLHCHPRNFPENLLLDKHVLGFILINTKDRKSLCSVHPQRNESEGGQNSSSTKITSEHRLQILRSYYKLTVSTVFREASEEALDLTNVCKPLSKDRFLGHCCQETYLIAKTHKLYALRTDHYQIFVLYSMMMPSFALRGVTNNTLQLLTTGKHLRV